MKKIICILLAAVLALSMCACMGKSPQPEEKSQLPSTATTINSNAEDGIGTKTEEPEKLPDQPGELGVLTPAAINPTGSWHLDEAACEIQNLADAFPGYAEWGSSMEIQDDGHINWFIGAESWYGSYLLDADGLHANMTAYLDGQKKAWELEVSEKDGTKTLKMDYDGNTMIWLYGDSEDKAAGADEMN